MQNKLFFSSYIVTILGILFLVLEYLLYQNVAENNVVQESFFMPLGFLLSFIGILIWFVAMVFFIKNEINKPK